MNNTPSIFGLTFGWGAIFSLAGTIMTTVLGGGVLGVWLSKRAENRKVDLDGDATLRADMRTQMEGMKQEIARLSLRDEEKGRRMTIAETRISQQDSQIGQLRFLLKLMNSELERVSPGNAIAREVRILMEALQEQATTSTNAEETGIMADVMSKLCVTKGPDE